MLLRIGHSWCDWSLEMLVFVNVTWSARWDIFLLASFSFFAPLIFWSLLCSQIWKTSSFFIFLFQTRFLWVRKPGHLLNILYYLVQRNESPRDSSRHNYIGQNLYISPQTKMKATRPFSLTSRNSCPYTRTSPSSLWSSRRARNTSSEMLTCHMCWGSTPQMSPTSPSIFTNTGQYVYGCVCECVCMCMPY